MSHIPPRFGLKNLFNDAASWSAVKTHTKYTHIHESFNLKRSLFLRRADGFAVPPLLILPRLQHLCADAQPTQAGAYIAFRLQKVMDFKFCLFIDLSGIERGRIHTNASAPANRLYFHPSEQAKSIQV
jgi:hypothetical protein